MMVTISGQAMGLIKHIKDFDMEDFEKWWKAYPEFTAVGTQFVFQYLDMKDRELWKNGEITLYKEKKEVANNG